MLIHTIQIPILSLRAVAKSLVNTYEDVLEILRRYAPLDDKNEDANSKAPL